MDQLIPIGVILVGLFIVAPIVKAIIQAVADNKHRREQERQSQIYEDELQKSPTMAILEHVKSLPASSWRLAGEEDEFDRDGLHIVRIFKSATRNGLTVELHTIDSSSRTLFVDGTKIDCWPTLFGEMLDAIQSSVQKGYTRDPGPNMHNLLDKM